MTSHVVNNNIYKINGITGAVIVLFLFCFTSTLFSYFFDIHSVCYYWLTFTILTGIWEYTYVTNRKLISQNAEDLIKTNLKMFR